MTCGGGEGWGQERQSFPKQASFNLGPVEYWVSISQDKHNSWKTWSEILCHQLTVQAGPIIFYFFSGKLGTSKERNPSCPLVSLQNSSTSKGNAGWTQNYTSGEFYSAMLHIIELSLPSAQSMHFISLTSTRFSYKVDKYPERAHLWVFEYGRISSSVCEYCRGERKETDRQKLTALSSLHWNILTTV